jgi:hypothetical protein
MKLGKTGKDVHFAPNRFYRFIVLFSEIVTSILGPSTSNNTLYPATLPLASYIWSPNIVNWLSNENLIKNFRKLEKHDP